MKFNIFQPRFVGLIIFVVIALAAEESLRSRLRTYSKVLLQRDTVLPPLSKSLSDLALTYPNTFNVPDDERLSVEETVGLAVSSECVCPHLFKRANPQATPQLWDLIKVDDDGIFTLQVQAYYILGYIGDDRDATRMVDELRSYSGVLNEASRQRVEVIIWGLGRMNLRGIRTAKRVLDEMSHVEYWKGRFQFKPDNLFREHDLPPELETVCLIFDAQAMWLKDDWDPQFKKVLAGIANKNHRQRVESRFDLLKTRRGFVEAIFLESKKPTEFERQGLRLTYEKRDYLIRETSKAQREIWSSPHLHPWLRPRPLPE